LRSALATLPELHRAALTLRYFDEMDYRTGREVVNVLLRVPMKNYPGLMQSLDSLGRLENITVQRQDRTGRHLDSGSQPGQYRFSPERSACHAATNPGAKHRGDRVECAA